MRRFLVLGLVALLCVLTAAITALVVPTSTQSASTFFSTTRTFPLSSCPYGWKLTGGGAGELPRNSYYNSSSTEYALTGSYPTGYGWRATATVTRGTYSDYSGWRYFTSSYSPRVYVVCAR